MLDVNETVLVIGERTPPSTGAVECLVEIESGSVHVIIAGDPPLREVLLALKTVGLRYVVYTERR